MPFFCFLNLITTSATTKTRTNPIENKIMLCGVKNSSVSCSETLWASTAGMFSFAIGKKIYKMFEGKVKVDSSVHELDELNCVELSNHPKF
jgi:hypothetical protein